MMWGSSETAYNFYANDNNMNEGKSTTFITVHDKLWKNLDEKPERKTR